MKKENNLFWTVVLLHFLLFVSPVFVFGQSTVASRNDHIFPSAPQAGRFINFDDHGFLINGKRVFIVSAGMEYARVPRALWHDRLLRLKRAGFNAVEMYTFWNFHEPKENQFNFSGDHDLDAFLKMIKDMGMYAIVRVGPYYCGEWSMGGYPIWLKFKPGLRVREDNPQFLTAVDKFFDRLMPIVAKNQINNGGSVIMVQLENEHRAAWGTVTPNGYFRHLIDKTVSLGLTVPYFFSGLHSGNDPAGDISDLYEPTRPNPWFSTEYWGVWYLNYGPQDQDSTLYDRRTWKIIAHGGNGYNVYMAHGGTNFGYNNDRDMAASYDYGAPVGQAGDLRPIYYSFKRAAWFARSFQDVLENSTDEVNNKPTVSDTIVKVTARKSPAGTIAFLDNRDSVNVQFKITPPANNQIRASSEIKLLAGEIMPVVQDFQLNSEVKLIWAPARIYSIIPQGNTTTLLIYGNAGSSTRLYFSISKKIKIIKGLLNLKISGDILSFDSVISATSPLEYSFETGNHRIRIIVVNDKMASHSWFAEAGGQNDIIIGPAYVAGLTNSNSQVNLVTEQAWEDKNRSPVWIFKPAGDPIKIEAKPQQGKHIVKLKLGTWQNKDAAREALPVMDDDKWLHSNNPLQMGADGDISADAWYRTKLRVAETGDYILQFTNVRDRAELFLEGKRIDTGFVFNKTVNVHLEKGINYLLAVFTAHDGRNKLIFRTGEIDTIDAKGLSGPVTLQKANGSGPLIAVNNWTMSGGQLDMFGETGWKLVPLKSPCRPQFYRTTFYLPALKGIHPIWRVNTTSLSYGSVWVNGHNLGRYPEKIKISGMYIPECWLKTGNNKIVIYEENGELPGKVAIEAEIAASRDIQYLRF